MKILRTVQSLVPKGGEGRKVTTSRRADLPPDYTRGPGPLRPTAAPESKGPFGGGVPVMGLWYSDCDAPGAENTTTIPSTLPELQKTENPPEHPKDREHSPRLQGLGSPGGRSVASERSYSRSTAADAGFVVPMQAFLSLAERGRVNLEVAFF